MAQSSRPFNERRSVQNKLGVPVDIKKRKLPPLPIHKRRLPALPNILNKNYILPQSKSTMRFNAASTISPKGAFRSTFNNRATTSTNLMKRMNNHPAYQTNSDYDTDEDYSDGYNSSNSNRSQPQKTTKSQSLRNLKSSSSLRNLKKGMSEWFGSKLKNKKNIKCQIPSQYGHQPSISRQKSYWKPTLNCIYDDNELLNALILFMTKQYNEENILFLQSVKRLNEKINKLLITSNMNGNYVDESHETKINYEIESIYTLYIEENAKKQVNLSHDCYINVTSSRNTYIDLNFNGKSLLFSECVDQIERLMQTSVLTGFYSSDDFQDIAHTRGIPCNDSAPSSCATSPRSTTTTPKSILNLNGTYFDVSNTSNTFNLSTPNTTHSGQSTTRSNASNTSTNVSYSICTDATVNTWCSSIDFDNLNKSMLSMNGIQESQDFDNDNDDDDLKEHIHFDETSTKVFKEKSKYLVSSNCFDTGYHEWTIRILQCNEFRQEFGVISKFDMNIKLSEYGICDTPAFGSRVVYGYNKYIEDKHNKLKHTFYYASYNNDNSIRCNKDLSNLDNHRRGLVPGDVIKIALNLNKGNIKFYLNDKKIRKTISVEKNVKYYPIICHSGNCQYKIL